MGKCRFPRSVLPHNRGDRLNDRGICRGDAEKPKIRLESRPSLNGQTTIYSFVVNLKFRVQTELSVGKNLELLDVEVD